MAVDLEVVRHALTVARRRNYASIELESPELTFSADLARGHSLPAAARTEEADVIAEEAEVRIIRSQLVGYFDAGAKPVKVGNTIAAEDVVGLVAVLGIPNEIVAGVAGVVEEILVKSGDPVEYGQALLKVNPE